MDRDYDAIMMVMMMVAAGHTGSHVQHHRGGHQQPPAFPAAHLPHAHLPKGPGQAATASCLVPLLTRWASCLPRQVPAQLLSKTLHVLVAAAAWRIWLMYRLQLQPSVFVPSFVLAQ